MLTKIQVIEISNPILRINEYYNGLPCHEPHLFNGIPSLFAVTQTRNDMVSLKLGLKL